jgi:hypothetical protein
VENFICTICGKSGGRDKFRYVTGIEVVYCNACYAKQPFYGYTRRNYLLRQLGFRSYQEYTRSELWGVIRKQVLCRDGYKCFCGKTATEVHHQSYRMDVLVGKDITPLISLCRACHFRAEFRNGEKTDFSVARRNIRVAYSSSVGGEQNAYMVRMGRVAAAGKKETLDGV